MAHIILFKESFQGFILTEPEVTDLIEMFYRWGDSTFVIGCADRADFMGEHSGHAGDHVITLCRSSIEHEFEAKKRVGGNLPAPNLRIAAACVLAHELQHANQTKIHRLKGKFFGHLGGRDKLGRTKMQRYWHRACERDARQFVDERMPEICAYFDAPFQTMRNGGAVVAKEWTDGGPQRVAALLREGGRATMDDIREALRAEGVLSPAAVAEVVALLR